MTTTDLELNQWPLAAIHIGERRLRGQLRSLGVPVGPLLKFGAKAYALKKSWQDRYQPWRTIRDEVQVLGPALQSSFTSTSYYVRSTETQKYFYTDDVVIPSADQPEADDDHVYLPLQQEPSGSAAWGGDIPRRSHNYPCWAWRGSLVPMLTNGPVRMSKNGWVCIGMHQLQDHGGGF